MSLGHSKAPGLGRLSDQIDAMNRKRAKATKADALLPRTRDREPRERVNSKPLKRSKKAAIREFKGE